YAPNFIPGVGNTDGEIMETLWSSLNIVSPSTWGMATPHQHKMLDFQMNDSNFHKMIRMNKGYIYVISQTDSFDCSGGIDQETMDS
ncbi:hypothetical protein J3A83DRAFT_4106722, partial [Scleroderma citrinum]